MMIRNEIIIILIYINNEERKNIFNHKVIFLEVLNLHRQTLLFFYFDYSLTTHIF